MKNIKGFTLIELLVVILIIGILAAIALPQYRRAVGSAEFSVILPKIKAIVSAQNRYYIINDTYSTRISSLDIEVGYNSVERCTVADKTYVACYEKNYILVYFYENKQVECYARNKTLITVCEKFFNKSAQLSENAGCSEVGGKPCWLVYGVKFPI